jgi:hypothetical protein
MLQNLLPIARILSPHFIREVYITKFLILFMFVTYIYIYIKPKSCNFLICAQRITKNLALI